MCHDVKHLHIPPFARRIILQCRRPPYIPPLPYQPQSAVFCPRRITRRPPCPTVFLPLPVVSPSPAAVFYSCRIDPPAPSTGWEAAKGR